MKLNKLEMTITAAALLGLSIFGFTKLPKPLTADQKICNIVVNNKLDIMTAAPTDILYNSAAINLISKCESGEQDSVQLAAANWLNHYNRLSNTITLKISFE